MSEGVRVLKNQSVLLVICIKKRRENQVKKNEKIALDILESVGGKENISNVFHCMTRLRFNLKDKSLINQEEVDEIDGVLGLNIDSGEFQFIIGPSVGDVYDEVLMITGFERTEPIEECHDDFGKGHFSIKNVFNNIINVFSACMNPLVPIFVLLGMANVISALIGPDFLNFVSKESDIYRNFYWIGQAIIYFLPVLLALTASKAFKANTFLSLVLAGILLYPDFVALMETEGASYSVFGIPVASVTYGSSVIPIILIVWIQSYVEDFVNRVCPDAIKVIIVPLITVLIMLPISFCALGPLGNYIGVLLSQFFVHLNSIAGPLETMIVGALIPFFVAFGIGRPIFFICLTTLLSEGVEYAYLPLSIAVGNWLTMGVALGYIIKSKDKKSKQLGLTCFIANLLGGVSEPTLFGILLPNKKTYLPIIIGGAIAGLYTGIMRVGLYQFGPSNFLNVLGFVGGSNANFINGCIACGLGIVITFIMMMVLYKAEETAE